MRFHTRFSLFLLLIFVSAVSGRSATPAPAIAGAGTQGTFPLGAFSTTVTGSNFTPSSVAQVCGAAVPTSYVNSSTLKIYGFCSKAGANSLIVSNGTVKSAPRTITVGMQNAKVSPAAARRFLEQAAFGPSPSDALAVQTTGMSAWINAQFSMPQVSTYANITQPFNGLPERFMTDAVTAPDQLRQRVAFALSQIFVTSQVQLSNASMIPYQDLLLADAFTNYQKIMTDVTLSPGMGQYLNMANNSKADPTTGNLANENYARELMQLFTIGVNKLNSDGSTVIGAGGLPAPTYSQFQVTEFARVFTGWTYQPYPGKALKWPNNLNPAGQMVPFPAEHDTGSKQLLNGYVSPAGSTPQQDLANAISNIFNHPNAGPFVSRLLIQHLVKSNPSAGYISRVVSVFNRNSAGVRGDMKSVISAILLDPEARANDSSTSQKATDGHLQEPALFIAGMYRAFGGTINDSNNYHWYLSTIGENLMWSTDVFSYYDWNYNLPSDGLRGPEFEINTPNAAVLRANLVQGLFGAFSSNVQTAGKGTMVDLTPYVYLGASPAVLVDALDLTLTHGTMPAEMKDIVVTAVTGERGGNLRRVQRGIYLILNSSYYNVWH